MEKIMHIQIEWANNMKTWKLQDGGITGNIFFFKIIFYDCCTCPTRSLPEEEKENTVYLQVIYFNFFFQIENSFGTFQTLYIISGLASLF